MDLAARLTLLEDHGLIRLAGPGGDYIFRHALLREAAYSSLLKADRRSVHQAVGETLTQLYGEAAPELTPVLARHFAEAGQLASALRYFLRAAQQASQHYANAEALSHYAEAQALAARLAEQGPVALEVWEALYLGRGRTLELRSRHAEALADYEHLLTLAQARVAPAVELAALMAIAVVRVTPTALHNLEIGEPLARRALALAEQLGDQRAQARAAWLMQLLGFYRHWYAEAVAHGERAVQLARALGWDEQLAFALNDLHAPYEHLGRYVEANAVLHEAVALWRTLGNWPMLADTLGNLAGTAVQNHQWTQAFAYTAEIRTISLPIDNVWGLTYADWLNCYAYIAQGEWGLGLRAASQALHLGLQGGLLDAQVYMRLERALILLGLGATPAAWAELAQAQQLVAEQSTYQRTVALTEMWMRLLSGEVAEAQRLWAMHQPADLLQGLALNAQLPSAAIELALQTHHPADALVQARTVLEALTTATAGVRSLYLMLLGRAHAALGDAAAAHAALTEALARADADQLRPLAFSISVALQELTAPATPVAAWPAALQARLHALAAAAPPEHRATFLQQPVGHYRVLYVV